MIVIADTTPLNHLVLERHSEVPQDRKAGPALRAPSRLKRRRFA